MQFSTAGGGCGDATHVVSASNDGTLALWDAGAVTRLPNGDRAPRRLAQARARTCTRVRAMRALRACVVYQYLQVSCP